MRFKPKIKYTEMCIWIDNNVYNENGFDENQMFEYLRCLFYALAFKKKFFTKTDDYQNYSLYAATATYMRLIDKRQFLPDDDPNKKNQIKSILNYIKKILYPMKINYQNDSFNKVLNDEVQGDGLQEHIKEDLYKNILSNTNDIVKIEINNYLKTIPRVIKNFLTCTPYASDKLVLNNLYISCLLTILKGITLSNKNRERLKHKLRKSLPYEDDLISEIFNDERLNANTNWHLDKGMENLVAVYCVKLNKLIIRDIRSLISDYIPSEDILQDILMSPLSDLNEDDND